ncbi:hypothetical protein CSQ85_11800 [Bifidobacterium rousetti]|uniref:hypothetical protein n=1 Tax=Bifidobacterium rousetti TaxID=2045439 RepID=UPI001238F071|nr:hypothetical protein [Bifidobacterium rousetti]KAA8816103.1 hypothetical protein CSQ85_11800 [Bifidobacterium rousetti]
MTNTVNTTPADTGTGLTVDLASWVRDQEAKQSIVRLRPGWEWTRTGTPLTAGLLFLLSTAAGLALATGMDVPARAILSTLTLLAGAHLFLIVESVDDTPSPEQRFNKQIEHRLHLTAFRLETRIPRGAILPRNGTTATWLDSGHPVHGHVTIQDTIVTILPNYDNGSRTD